MAAYQADGFLPAASGYADTLRVLGMDGTGDILAAVDNGHILGTVTLVTWPWAVPTAGAADVCGDF